ncbi:MAG: TolC family protein [Myxococcales bacterium]|nr:TolC family protein [Myxococcales bacterium]
MSGLRRACFAAALAASAAACVPSSPRNRSDIADALRERSGYSVGAYRDKASIPAGVTLADGLSAEETVALALWNNARLQATLAQLGLSKADLFRAGEIPNPVVSIFFPVGPKQLEWTARWSLDWLWRRPFRVAAAKLDVERVAHTLVAAGLDTVRQARDAHAQAAFAEQRQKLLEVSAKTWQSVADLVASRLRAGAASLFEVTAAQSDARVAAVTASQHARTVAMRRAELREVINLPRGAARRKLPAVLAPRAPADRSVDIAALTRRALSSRPEVLAAKVAIVRAGKAARLAVAQIFTIVGGLDSNAQGREGFELGPAADITLPIFNQNQAGRQRARSELRQATWTYAAIARQVRREVAVAAHRFEAARAAIVAWRLSVLQPLELNLVRGTKAYKAGAASYLQVLDATRKLVDARLRRLQLQLEQQLSFHALCRAVGRRL